MIECARRHILCLCDELHEMRNKVFNTCGRGDFESAYFAPDLVHLQYRNIYGADEDGGIPLPTIGYISWHKFGNVFGHKELIDEITTNKRHISLEVCSLRICFISLPVPRETQEVVKHSYSTTLRGCGQQNKIRH